MLGPDNPHTPNTTMFEVEAEALHYVRVHDIYHSNPLLKPLHYISAAECAIHFWRKGLPGAGMVQLVD